MEDNRFELFSTSAAYIVKMIQVLKSYKMGQYGLKGTTCSCLCQLLASEDGLTAGELSERCSIDKAQVSRCTADLISCGFIYRNDCEGRRYRQKYVLTDAGRTAALDISNTTRQIQSQAEKGVSEDELDAFYRVLAQMCDNLSDLCDRIN